jgi:hypothetical protein
MTRILLAALLSVAFGTIAHADRAPTAEERAKIEQALRGQGFTQWKKIEFDDARVWEVDDAIAADGKRYDLKLDQSLAIIKREAD